MIATTNVAKYAQDEENFDLPGLRARICARREVQEKLIWSEYRRKAKQGNFPAPGSEDHIKKSA